MTNRYQHILITTIVALCYAPIVSAESSESDAGIIEEMVVTAQKREQALEDVPQSIQVMDMTMIEDASLRDLAEMMTFIPGASEGLGFALGSRRYQIRGIYPAAGNNTIGFYLGDAPMEAFSGTAPIGRLYDMQQVEVLRGPQSTLYGNGAMGGVIRYVPNEPDLQEFDVGGRTGWSQTEGGDDGNYIDAFISIPVIEDKLGIRVVASQEDVGGFAETLSGQEDANGGDLNDFRISLLAEPTDRFSLNVMYAQSESNQDSSMLLSGLFPNDTIQDTGPNDFADIELEVLSATLEYDLGFADVVLTSTNAESTYDTAITFVLPFVSTVVSSLTNVFDTTSHELRLVSQGDQLIQWMVGVYSTNRDEPNVQDIVWTPEIPPFFVNSNTSTKNKRESLAYFGEVSIDLLDGKLVPLIGMRAADEELSGDNAISAGVPGGAEDFDITNYRFNLSWIPNDNAHLYLNIAEGFRSGVFNDLAVCTTHNLLLLEGTCELVQPTDELVSYEVGTKLRLVDGDLNLEAAYYVIDWERPPQQIGIGGLFQSYAVGDADISGFDLSLVYTPSSVEGLEISLVSNWNKAEFTSVESVVAATLVPPFTPESLGPRDGESLPFVPDFSGTLSISYGWNIRGGWNGMVNVTHNHLSGQWGQFGGGSVQGGSRDLLRARVGASNDNFGIYLFARNLLDEDATIYNQSPTGGLPVFTQDYPRQVGIELTYNLR